MRDQLLSAKLDEIQEQLKHWAVEQNVLLPGERIIFSLRIENFPSVVAEEYKPPSNHLLDMQVKHFFSRKRLTATAERLGIKGTCLITLAINGVPRLKGGKYMRDFVESGITLSSVIPSSCSSKCSGVGEKTLRLLFEAMIEVGLVKHEDVFDREFKR